MTWDSVSPAFSIFPAPMCCMMRDKAVQCSVLLNIIKNCKVCVSCSWVKMIYATYCLITDALTSSLHSCNWKYDHIVIYVRGRHFCFETLHWIHSTSFSLYCSLSPLARINSCTQLISADNICELREGPKFGRIPSPSWEIFQMNELECWAFLPSQPQIFKSLNSFLLPSALQGNCTDKVSAHQKDGMAVALLFPGQLLWKRAASPLRSY